VSPVKYELGSYIAEDILHSHRRENLKSYITAISFHIPPLTNATVVLLVYILMVFVPKSYTHSTDACYMPGPFVINENKEGFGQ
jgi:hypothetical protein